MDKIVLFVTITEPKRSPKLLEYCDEKQIPLNLLTKGRGTAGQDILDYLGLGEPERDVLFSVMTLSRAEKLMRWLKINMLFDIPGNGIAFMIPLDSVAGGTTLKYFLSGADDVSEHKEGEAKSMSAEYKHELIIAITNRGHVENVMEAAREAEAGGGTVIHARGTGAKLAEKFFGVTLSDEKDIVFIVSDTSAKAAIMKNIVSKAGMKSESQTIVFSVPVSDVLGIRERIKDDNE